MAVTLYTYAKLCDASRLTQEIGDSAIVTAIDHIQTAPNLTNVYMKAALSGGDETILNGLVTAHTNTPLEENKSILASVSSIPSFGAKTFQFNGATKTLYARNTGIQQALSFGSNTISYSVPYAWSKIIGVEVINSEALDYVDLKVRDTAQGTYSGVPNYVLNQFAYSHNIPKDYYIRMSQFDADIYVGMVIEITYTSRSAKTVGLNFILNEVKD